MMDFSSIIDGTLVFFGVASVFMWAWSTLGYNSSTVSTNALSGFSASAADESSSWRLAA